MKLYTVCIDDGAGPNVMFVSDVSDDAVAVARKLQAEMLAERNPDWTNDDAACFVAGHVYSMCAVLPCVSNPAETFTIAVLVQTLTLNQQPC